MLDNTHSAATYSATDTRSVDTVPAEHSNGTPIVRRFLVTRLVPVTFIVDMHGGTIEDAAAMAVERVEKGLYNGRIDWDRLAPSTVEGVYSKAADGVVFESVPRVFRRAEQLTAYFGRILGMPA